MKNSSGILITARLKSTRLKKKIIKNLNNIPLISYQIKKIKSYFKNNKIILITSKLKTDDLLIDIAKSEDILFFRGSSLDVLRRIYEAANKFKIENIISITADNPLIDVKLLKKGFDEHVKKKNDFSYTTGLPLGTFGYYVKKNTIADVLKWKKKINTEVWGSFITNNKKYKSGSINFNLKYISDPKKYRFTIDYKEDLKFANRLLSKTNLIYPDLKNLIQICNKYPEILKINKKMKQKPFTGKVY